MAATQDGVLNLAALRPKGLLRLRLMFDGFWKWLTLIALLFTAIGVVAGGVAGYFVLLEVRYDREGHTATGKVTDKDTYATRSSDSNISSTHHRVAYTFTAPDGSVHSGRGETTQDRWEPLKPGDPIEVQYLASSPATNRLLGERTGGIEWLIVLFPLLFGGVGLILLLVCARSAGRTARLLARGILTRGVVQSKQERTSITINDRHPYDVTFTFSLADGTARTGTALVTDIKLAQRLEPGTPIGAIYLPDAPDQCAVFNERWRKHFH